MVFRRHICTYLLAVQTAIVGSDGEELVTADGEAVGLGLSGILESCCQRANLLRGNLHRECCQSMAGLGSGARSGEFGTNTRGFIP